MIDNHIPHDEELLEQLFWQFDKDKRYMDSRTAFKAKMRSYATKYAQSLQAKVDALMLEYCPEQMTPEQLEEWAKHQVKVDINEV